MGKGTKIFRYRRILQRGPFIGYEKAYFSLPTDWQIWAFLTLLAGSLIMKVYLSSTLDDLGPKQQAVKDTLDTKRDMVKFEKSDLFRDEAFVTEKQKRIGKEKDDLAIPRQQKQPMAKPLPEVAAQYKNRKTVIIVAYKTGAYSQREIRAFYQLRPTTIGIIVRKNKDSGSGPLCLRCSPSSIADYKNCLGLSPRTQLPLYACPGFLRSYCFLSKNESLNLSRKDYEYGNFLCLFT